MQAIQKKAAPVDPALRPSLRDINDPADLAAFARLARVDPRAAASALATWIDRQRVHYEGSDLARTLDDYAYDPDDDTLDTLAWYAGPGRRLKPSVRVALCAVVSGARRMRS